MATLSRTSNHRTIRVWVEQRGGVPVVVKGSGGLLRIDFVRGPGRRGRDAALEEVSWDEWFAHFDACGLSFVHNPARTSRYLKIVSAARNERRDAPARERRWRFAGETSRSRRLDELLQGYDDDVIGLAPNRP